MKISRVTILTLGVVDLGRATEFYKAVLGTPANPVYAKSRAADLHP